MATLIPQLSEPIDSIAAAKLFIKKLVDEQYLIWNVSEKKMPKLKHGISWSTATLEDIKPSLDLKSNLFGMRTGIQPNGRYIIGLDFDMWVKSGTTYVECKETVKLYKEFEAQNPLNIGVFASSTEQNRGVLVDITNVPELIELIDTDGRRKIQKKGYCLEVLTSFNMVLPPTKTICKIRQLAVSHRYFLNQDPNNYILELTSDSPITKFICYYITQAREVKTLTPAKLKYYEKNINYKTLTDEIENDLLSSDGINIKPYMTLLNKERISNYNSWMKIGLALKNIYKNDEEGYKLFDYMSSLDIKSYNQPAVQNNWNIWNAYRDKYTGLNHNYILSLAHKDDPAKFCQLFQAAKKAEKDAIYARKLADFQKEVKFILHPPMYMSYNAYTGRWIQYSAADLYDVYKIKYGREFIKDYLADETINYYDAIDFIPDINFKPSNPKLRIYNSFEGFMINNIISAIPSGDNTELPDCDIILKHIKFICNENANTIGFFIQWLAHLIFNTTKRCGIVPVIQGVQKAGKGTLYEIICKILGKTYCLMTSTPENDIFTRFNDALHEKVLVNINEAEYKNFASSMEQFKSLITDSTFNMESKNQRRIELKNYLWFIITTNNDRLFNISGDDRRFYFITTSSVIRTKEYFDEIYKAMDDDIIITAFYKYLEGKFEPNYNFSEQRIACKTEYQSLLETVSKPPFYVFLQEFLEADTDETRPDICIKPKLLIEKYGSYCRDNRIANNETGSSIKIKLLRLTGVIFGRFTHEREFNYYYRLSKIDILNYMHTNKLI